MAKNIAAKRRFSFYTSADLAKRIAAFGEENGNFTEAAICRVLIELGLNKAESVDAVVLRQAMTEGAIAGWTHIRLAIMRAVKERGEGGVS